MVGEHDTRLWRVLHHYVDQARARVDASAVTRVAIDETAARRGHDYITLFVDIDQARVLFATEGKDAATVAAFADDLAAHGGDAEAVDEVCIDMSPAFIKGTAEHLPNAAVTFDKFHAVKIVNDAVDQVRRAEQKGQSVLRGTRYIWLRNPANLSDRQQATLDSLPTRHLKTARAYQIRLAFQDLYDQPSAEAGAGFLKKWYFWATHSRLPPMIDAARTVKHHWDGILRWFDSRIANGLIEGINSLVQAAKAKARGYRSTRNLKAIVYLLAGKLDLELQLDNRFNPCQTAKNQHFRCPGSVPLPLCTPSVTPGAASVAVSSGDRGSNSLSKRHLADHHAPAEESGRNV